MSNSSLITYKKLTGNYDSRRNKVDTITIHCYVGQVTAKQGCDYFYNTGREVSSNYVVGYDGSIGLSVEEKNRAWTSSSPSNDHRAITIETASATSHPYRVTNAAYKALINLCTDICKRNGIKKLVWSSKESDRVNHKNGCNMTLHRDFANTACPGQYLIDHMQDIANQVNKRLNSTTTTTPTTTKPSTSSNGIGQIKSQNIGGNDMTRGYLQKGDRNEAVYAYKQLLMALKKAKIISQGVDDNNIYGAGTVEATKQVQRAAKIEVDGLAGSQTMRACYLLLAKKL